MRHDLKERFDYYFSKITRSGVEELHKYLMNCGYFTSASSTKFHGACVSGNLEHSINVTDILLNLYDSQDQFAIPEESLIICGLFHDLGKSTYYEKDTYIPNILKSGNLSESEPFKKNKDLIGIPHEVASIHMLSTLIELTEQEVFAILYHNGLYVSSGRDISGKEQPLQLLLHWADMWESRFIGKNVSAE